MNASLYDNTQTDDNDELGKLFIKRPTANPVRCAYVTPKRSEPNSLKVDKDKTLTIDFL